MPFDHKHESSSCNCVLAKGQPVQSLTEMDFERGIWYAAINKETDRLRQFIEKGQVDDRDNSGYTALHYAARNGSEEICRKLLEAHADVNATTNGGATPLHRAAMMGHLNIVRLLIESGAKLELQDQDGQTALHRSAEKGHLQISEYLLSKCGNLKAIADKKDRKPIDLVSGKNDNCGELKKLL